MPDSVGNIGTGRSGQCPGILSGHLCPDTGTVARFPVRILGAKLDWSSMSALTCSRQLRITSGLPAIQICGTDWLRGTR